MASIVNRSAFTVTVPGYRGKDKNKYTRKFAYGKLKDAEAYIRALIEQGLTPDITQGETTFQVKVVRVGHEPQCETFHSLREAEAYVKRIEAEAEVGLFRDYTQAAKTTTADLIRRYMEEDCPGMKGGDNYIIILRAMLEDSSHELRKRIAQRKAEIKEFGKALTPLGANRQPMTSLEWLHLPLHKVKPEHIEDFIADEEGLDQRTQGLVRHLLQVRGPLGLQRVGRPGELVVGQQRLHQPLVLLQPQHAPPQPTLDVELALGSGLVGHRVSVPWRKYGAGRTSATSVKVSENQKYYLTPHRELLCF